MAPTRKRAKPAVTADKPPVRDRRTGDGSDDESSHFDIVQLCLQYGNKHEEKHKAKAAIIRKDLKALSSSYISKVEQTLIDQHLKIEKSYDIYWAEVSRVTEERRSILKEMNDNYNKMEYLRNTLAERTVGFETQRYNKGKESLDAADKQVKAATATLQRSVRTRKNAFHTARGNKRKAVSSAAPASKRFQHTV